LKADQSAYGRNDLRITPSHHADQVPRAKSNLRPIRAFSISDLSRMTLKEVFFDGSSPRRGSKDARSFPRLKEMGELTGGFEYPAANAAIASLTPLRPQLH
jgi:hypothetical protein